MTDAKRDYSQLMKEALLELKQLRAKLDDVKRAQTEPIAIVGMSCRLPGGVQDPDGYWRLLREGVDAIREVPADRWDSSTYYDPDQDAPGKMATRFGGFIDRIDEFDPTFFGISPREARSLDPQQRLLLEVTWEAIERSGQSPAQLYGTATGVFVGMSTFDYALHQVGGRVGAEDLNRIDGYVATGTTMSPAAGRLSYVLGLNGPSMVVDTACSSSLVATHLAVTSLRERECDLALVGGVNLILRPEWNVNFTKAHMLAPDGRCKTFDSSADGYSRGEGCGVVVLQRLSDALAAGRNVIAVIRSSAVNQDGASGGLTVPSGPSQEHVIRRALSGAGIRPHEVSYVEAHGTGTSLGDPIEVAALGAVFGERSKEDPLRIGSVKTNIGHLEAAAGIAGLMKVALALRHREIPPHLHFRQRSPFIDWDRLPIAVPVERTPWRSADQPRRAGVSSFGFTGTNAHVVVEEAPPESERAAVDAAASRDRPLHVLTLSARTADALTDLAGRYERRLAEHSEVQLQDVAFTANTGRAQFRHRLAVVAASSADAQRKLAAYSGRQTSSGIFAGHGPERPKVAFLFTGQGSQYVGMGRQLYETQPLFRETLDRCDEILRRHLGRPLREVIYPQPGQSSPLDDTAYTQPALFALEAALAAVWKSWGIEPDAVMGHSVGEYAAAYVAGVFSLEDGLALIAERARLMQALSDSGQMVAVQAREHRAAAAIAAHEREVSLAAINGPNSVVISGASHAVSAVVASLQADGIATQSLRVSHAFHSPLMEPMLANFQRVAERVAFARPTREIISNVTGDVAGPEMLTAGYWVRHVRQPVRFAEGMDTLKARGYRVFVEIGPASTLLALGRGCVPDQAAAWLPSLRAAGDWDQMLQTLGELYSRGASIDWIAFDRRYTRRSVDLPTYPFQRQRYWIDISRRAGVALEQKANGDSVNDSAADAGADRRPIEQDVYGIEWREQPRPPIDEARRADGRWIVLGDPNGLGASVVSHLRQRGARCTLVSSGHDFARIDAEHLRVDPSSASDLDRLWSAFASSDPVRGIIHLWSLDSIDANELDAERLHRCDALLSALRVLQTVVKSGTFPKPALWCVTRGAVVVGTSAAEPVSLAQAPQWGFGRVAALEHPDVWGGLIDLGPDTDGGFEAQAIAEELMSGSGEDQIAFRDRLRYVPRLVPGGDRPSARQLHLNGEGTYLIAGGAGALGLHAARWLVSSGARHLVLASRRPLTTPNAHRTVRELETAGATVLSLSADISREEDIENILETIAASGRPLRGIVHAAGVDARMPIIDMAPDDLRTMTASKIRGGWLLHDKTRHLDLNLFVCFSSVSAVWGAPSRAHYAAANAFLDALAHERRRLGLPAISINWGPWRGGGMASDDELQQLHEAGLRSLDPARALRILDLLVARGESQATVADADWNRFRSTFAARRRRPLLEEVAPTEEWDADVSERSTGDWIDRLRALSPEQRPSVLQELLRAEVADTLGFSQATDVPLDQSVFELGMDSLRAVQLAMRLQQHLGLSESIQFFDCPEVRPLATRLLERVHLATPRVSTNQSDRPGPSPARGTPESPAVSGYSPEFEAEIFAFSRAAWPHRPEALVESRWRWMFVESAKRLCVEPRVWLYRDDSRVVAHHAAIPVRLKVGPEEFDSGWFADTMVLHSHRSQATGARLLIESNDAFEIGLSLGQTEQMRTIALRLGWVQVAALKTFVLLLNPRAVFKDKLNPLLASVADSGLLLRQSLKRLSAGPKDGRLEARLVERFDTRHDQLWNTVKGEYGCAVTRDASYLNWKYVTQPGPDFLRLEFLQDGSIVAAAILALDRPGAIFSYRRAIIVDLVVAPSDSKLVLAVLDSIRRRCVERDIDAVFVHLINDRLERILQNYGFMPRKPRRFLLVNADRTSTGARQLLSDPKNWLVTMGDSDIDRPWEIDGSRVQLRKGLD